MNTCFIHNICTYIVHTCTHRIAHISPGIYLLVLGESCQNTIILNFQVRLPLRVNIVSI